MRFKWLSCKTAAVVAFMMGLAMAEQARADWGFFNTSGDSWN